jgi:hypothetical protein
MEESDLKTTIDYVPAGKKKPKQYDAVVVEAIKNKYITVEVAEVSSFPMKLTWDKSLYSAVSFGNKITCEYTIIRDFTATKREVRGNTTQRKSEVVSRRTSGRPIK